MSDNKSINMYNLDITTLIACVSDITNDSTIATRFGKIDAWKERNASVYHQIMDELNDPLLPKLKEMFKDKILVATRKAVDKTFEIIKSLGSSYEKKRLDDFLKTVTVIPDDPSDTFLVLTGKNWTDYNKSVFGTSHKLKIPLITGNLALYSIILNDMLIEDLDVTVHRARCFVGEKHNVSNEIAFGNI